MRTNQRSKLNDVSYRSPVRNSLPGLFVCLFFRASTSTHYNNDYIAIITECKSFLLKKKMFVCLYAGLTQLFQRVQKKKSHSEKRSSLQTNFLPCGEIK